MVKLVQVVVEGEVRQVERMARQVEFTAGKVELQGLGVPPQREDSDRISVVEQQHSPDSLIMQDRHPFLSRLELIMTKYPFFLGHSKNFLLSF